MSSEGAGIRLREAPSVDETFRIDFNLRVRVVSLNAQIVYRHEGNLFGIRFVPSSAVEQEEIAQIIEFIKQRS
jgi:hypothetical protein